MTMLALLHAPRMCSSAAFISGQDLESGMKHNGIPLLPECDHTMERNPVGPPLQTSAMRGQSVGISIRSTAR